MIYFCRKCYKVFGESDYIGQFDDSRNCLKCYEKTIILNQNIIEDILILYYKEPIGKWNYPILRDRTLRDNPVRQVRF